MLMRFILPVWLPVRSQCSRPMDSPRVLIVHQQGSQVDALIDRLQYLGVTEWLHTSDTAQALTLLQGANAVDIVLCDLGEQALERLEFLRDARQTGRVRALVLCSELSPELRRAVGQMSSLAGLPLLGVLNQPLQLHTLRTVLWRYRQGRGRSLLTTRPVAILPSEAEIRRGLESAEFRAWYQPQLHMAHGELCAVEALARWQHPRRGLLRPRDFLAAVLAYDLIDELFTQVFEQGLELLASLHRQGQPLQLAFNLHASQLASPGLVAQVRQALLRHGLPGSSLTFELSESGVLDLPGMTEYHLWQLRSLGCVLAIDDFGAGFSSLKQMSRLPFTRIKLDGAFIQRPLEPCNRAIIASTLALSRSLGMELVIEGVSSQPIREALVGMGCQSGQGFFLARPMDGSRLRQWLRRVAYAPTRERRRD